MAHIYRRDIEAYVERLEYDWVSHAGKLYMGACGYPDTLGIVDFFKRIDSSIKQIDAMFDGRLVIRYERKPHGWVAAPVR